MASVVSAARKLVLRQLMAKVFGHVDPALPPVRSGRKFIKPLKGPELLSYYPEKFNIQKFAKELVKEDPSTKFSGVTKEEKYRLEILASRKARGKGPPKKMNGRRAAMKKK